jgi:uncharacterized protein YjeT (DUF2065 family)
MGMHIFVKILGIVLALVGVLYLLRPDIFKRLMEFFKKGKRIYFAGLLRFALAVVFLAGARECRYPWVIFAFGILFLMGGLLIFLLGPEKIRTILEWYATQPKLLLRVIGAIVVVLGAIIIFSA